MRKLIGILTCIFLFQVSKGQDTLREFEFGSTILTIISFDPGFSGYRPSPEFINGVFFRYTKKRFGLRIHASYSNNTTSSTSYYAGRPIGNQVNTKGILIGAGGQFTILKHKQWLYAFLDISYSNSSSAGYQYGPISQKSTGTSNGFDCFSGFGFKIKAFKNIYLSPEIGLYSSSQFINKTTTPTDVIFISGPVNYHSSYSETNLNPGFKLHLTVKF